MGAASWWSVREYPGLDSQSLSFVTVADQYHGRGERDTVSGREPLEWRDSAFRSEMSL